MSTHAVQTNLYYDDGTVIATDAYDTEVDNVAAYTANLANVSGASYGVTLSHNADGLAIDYASFDGKWTARE